MNKEINFSSKALLPLVIAIVVFAFIWIDVDADLQDPWFRAAGKVQKSAQIKDSLAKYKMLEEGGDELRLLVKEHPYHPRVHYLLGFYYNVAKKYDSAITELTIAIEEGSGAVVNQVDVEARKMIVNPIIQRTNGFLSAKEIAKAKKSNDQGIKLNPVEPIFWYQAGMIHEQMRKVDSAMICYDKALSLGMKNKDLNERAVRLFFNYGNSYFQKKEFEAALYYYKKTINVLPNNPDFNNNVGSSLLNLGRAKEALPYFQKAVKLKPKHPDFNRNLQATQQIINQQANTQANK